MHPTTELPATDETAANTLSRERRDHARVMDAVHLQVHRLSTDGTATAGRKGAQPVAASGLRKYDIAGYHEVSQQYPAVAEYINELESSIRKFRLQLGQADTDGAQRNRPNRKISLSVSGLAFALNELFLPGEELWIELTLFPQAIDIHARIRIVGSGDAGKLANANEHTYRAVFLDLGDTQKSQIERHVAKLLGRSRQGSDWQPEN